MPTLDEVSQDNPPISVRRLYEGAWATNSRRDDRNRARGAAAVWGPSAFESIYLDAADYGAAAWSHRNAVDIHRDVIAYYNMLSPTGVATAYQGPKVDAPTRETLTHSPAVPTDLDLSTPRRALALEAAALLGYGALAKDAGVPGELRRALAKLELEVLDEKSVDAYKAQMVRHYASHQKMAMPTWRLTSLREYTQPVPEHVLAKAVSIKRELPQAEFYVDQLAIDPFLIVTLKPLKDTNVNTASRKLDPEVTAYIDVWLEPKFEGTQWEA
jgi:hypothetical protein